MAYVPNQLVCQETQLLQKSNHSLITGNIILLPGTEIAAQNVNDKGLRMRKPVAF
jgi:hypothetical protein